MPRLETGRKLEGLVAGGRLRLIEGEGTPSQVHGAVAMVGDKPIDDWKDYSEVGFDDREEPPFYLRYYRDGHRAQRHYFDFDAPTEAIRGLVTAVEARNEDGTLQALLAGIKNAAETEIERRVQLNSTSLQELSNTSIGI